MQKWVNIFQSLVPMLTETRMEMREGGQYCRHPNIQTSWCTKVGMTVTTAAKVRRDSLTRETCNSNVLQLLVTINLGTGLSCDM
jgi:hypothetical protein